jgi:pantetheine-phosphate adenylyltransferase
MKTAVYPGSFDPFTNGHLAVLETAAQLFDKVIVAVLVNPGKTPLFSVEDRILQIRNATVDYGNVAVEQFQGLLVDYVRLAGANVIVRGLRDASDYESEVRLAHMNRTMEPAVPTVFIPTRPEVSFISSSLVKQVAANGGDVAPFVPETVAKALIAKFSAQQ